MFNFSSIIDLESKKFIPTHPETGVDLPAWIEIAGESHPKRKKIEMQRARELRARVAKRGRIEFADPEEDVPNQIDLLVACTLSWDGVCDDETNTPIPCTPENARRLYEDCRWLRDQANAFLSDNKNFLQSTAAD